MKEVWKERLKKVFGTREAIFLIFIVLLMLISFGVYTYFSFIHVKQCSSLGCFENAMTGCFKASYVNEQPEASWGYNIKGTSNEKCEVSVKLLQAKKGDVSIRGLNGLSMDCYFPVGTVSSPQEDLTKCSGKLREELQSFMINKLHIYIIDSLGIFNESVLDIAGF